MWRGMIVEPVRTGRSCGRSLCFLAFISHVSDYVDIVERIVFKLKASPKSRTAKRSPLVAQHISTKIRKKYPKVALFCSQYQPSTLRLKNTSCFPSEVI